MTDVDQSQILNAAKVLRGGGLVAFPTETVYGLGANALDGAAVARIFEAKGRPRINPLIVHLARFEQVEALCVVPEAARVLARAFWPGPMTMVLPRRPACPVSELVSAGLSSVGVRVPAHPVAHALLAAADVPVAAPSANTSGHVSATRACHVADDFGERIDQILDGGATPLGLESTVVAVSEAPSDGARDDVVVLRAGAVTVDALSAALGWPVERAFNAEGPGVQSPGQLESHYAPRARLRLNAFKARPGEALLAFGGELPDHDGACLNLSPRGDVVEAAANLFSMLRALDASGCARICVMPVPMDGLGEAINDRLSRASSPRRGE